MFYLPDCCTIVAVCKLGWAHHPILASSGTQIRGSPRGHPIQIMNHQSQIMNSRPSASGCVRLIFVGGQPALVMLSEAKHLANEGNLRFFSYAARILR